MCPGLRVYSFGALVLRALFMGRFVYETAFFFVIVVLSCLLASSVGSSSLWQTKSERSEILVAVVVHPRLENADSKIQRVLQTDCYSLLRHATVVHRNQS